MLAHRDIRDVSFGQGCAGFRVVFRALPRTSLIKTLFAVVAVVVFYLFFAAISVWGVAKLLLP